MHGIGGRLKAWREKNKLTQPGAASLYGVKPSSYQKYEMGLSAPGAEAMEKFVRAGINANWLLTGEGPMLLADLKPPPLLNKLNVDALEAIFEGSFIAAPRMPPEQRAGLCANLYKGLIDRGEITPDGIGTGDPNAQAA